MTTVSSQTGSFRLVAYQGDRKTLLAFDLAQADAANLAGFTIQCQPPGGGPAYYVHNTLQFEHPGDHAQDASQPPTASINAPIHKFRWVHVPGSIHQGIDPALGDYTYTVTPRYFANGAMTALDPARTASVTIAVQSFAKGNLRLGFTRGYVQSQGFANHFGKDALIRPKGKTLIYDTTATCGQNAAGQTFSFQDEYGWLGFTARQLVFELLKDVAQTPGRRLDVFAYDFNEPDVLTQLQSFAKTGRLRVILDNAALHHPSKPEDEAEALLNGAHAGTVIRGKFGRYAHDKVFVIYDNDTPIRVLTGSTNFSVTGLYVNSNHVLVFDDPEVAGWYAGVFQEAWTDGVSQKAFEASAWASKTYSTTNAATPPTDISFSPHTAAFATNLLGGLVARVQQEGAAASEGSVLFAVMQLTGGSNAVYHALDDLHAQQTIFSYGISDSPAGVSLYPIGSKTGVLVTGKPGSTTLPPPFNQIANIGMGHQVHDKFVVCGFNRPDAVVYCGSSNLAEGGEQANGDNLLAIHDQDVATVFAIEALLLVDHFDFLDRYPKTGSDGKTARPVPASKQVAAAEAGWFLSTDDKWTAKYFDPTDLHSVDRQLFA